MSLACLILCLKCFRNHLQISPIFVWTVTLGIVISSPQVKEGRPWQQQLYTQSLLKCLSLSKSKNCKLFLPRMKKKERTYTSKKKKLLKKNSSRFLMTGLECHFRIYLYFLLAMQDKSYNQTVSWCIVGDRPVFSYTF